MRIGQIFGRALLALALALAAGGGGSAQSPEGAAGRVVLLAAIEGAIGPATERHVERAIEAASERGAEALILRLNTPGGLADSMREVIAEILASPVPVVGWVAPPGAHAASAGTYILYATHVAAMAPGTNLGAATPVQIGGFPSLPERRDDDSGEEGGEEAERSPRAPADAMSAKAINDSVAFIRSLAELRGRNADWGEEAVREAASLSAAAAREEGVIDLLADDLRALLAGVDGRSVEIAGEARVLMTAGAAVEEYAVEPLTRLLGILSNPNVALLLMIIGVYGLIFEFSNPGTFGPGIVGAICLVLALYALNQLPLDYAGLALVLLGIAFMVAEGLTPSFGALGLGGLVAFVLGAAMLIDTDVPAYRVSWWAIAATAALSLAVLSLLLGYAWRAQRLRPVSGAAALIGAPAQVDDWAGAEGHVWAEGERWRAVGERDLLPGDRVRVRGIDGVTLQVGRGEGREGS